MRRPRPLLLVALFTALLAAAIGVAFVSAQHSWSRSAALAQGKRHLTFELRSIDSAALGNPGFAPVASSSDFVSGAFFQENLYLSGSAGLLVYSPDGVLQRTFRTGIDLPTAAPGALAVGRLRNAPQPQLLIATAGAGVLILEVDSRHQTSIRQLLPADAGSRDITALLPLPSGDLVIGTRRHGLLLYSGATLERFHVEVPGLDASVLQITALAADAAGFWVGTHHAGLLHAHAGTVEHIDMPDGLPDPQIDSIAIRGNRIFAGTPLGVAVFDAAASPTRLISTLAPGLFAHSVGADARDLLIGSLDQGIQQLPLDAAPRVRAASIGIAGQDLDAEPVQQFLAAGSGDSEGSPYAITHKAVLRRTSSGTWTPVLQQPAAALSDGNVSALAFGPDGRLWVGFFDHGLDVLSQALNHAVHFEDDHLFCINRLALDPRRGTMAAATANGLVLFDVAGKERQVLTRRDGLIADHVTDIAFTQRGMALATPAGITFVDTSGTQSLYAFQGLVNNHVYALGQRFEGSTGQLVAGTLGGLSMLDAESESVRRNLTVSNSGLRHNWITAIVPVPDGGWMIGTYGAGVMRLTREGNVEPMDFATPVSGQETIVNPNAMLVTDAHIYAGTLGRGLLVYDRASGRWSAVTKGLPSENVTALAAREGQLFVGTENGLVRIAEQALQGGGPR